MERLVDFFKEVQFPEQTEKTMKHIIRTAVKAAIFEMATLRI
jgi:hypothetical protein